MKLLEKESIHVTQDEMARQVLEVVPLVMRVIRTQMTKNRGSDLSVPQFRALGFLKRHEGTSLSAVAAHIGLELPSMSKLIDGLVERKLVVRESHTQDRRRVTLALSARGRAALQATEKWARAFLAERFAQLSDPERITLVQALLILKPLFTSEMESPAETSVGHNGHS
jgi:DNA-binding MarR family transcriptional regulator